MKKAIKAKQSQYERYPSERTPGDQYTECNRLRWNRKAEEVRFEFLRKTEK